MNKKVEVVEVEMTQEEKMAAMEAKLAELEAKLATKDEAITAQAIELDEMKKKEEGWLIVCNNPLYNGTTAGVLFTDGMAFIPKNRIYPRFVVEPLPDNVIESMLGDKAKYPHGARDIEEHKKVEAVPSSERMVKLITSDFGYTAEFFTKDQMDALQKRLNDRARERKEAQAKLGTQTEMMEKLLVAHRL
jgi:hypothetical protein